MNRRYHSFLIKTNPDSRGEMRWTIEHRQSGDQVLAPTAAAAAIWIATLTETTHQTTRHCEPARATRRGDATAQQ